MSEPSIPPAVPYRVSYSERVRQELRHLMAVARERGQAAEFLAALREIDRRLRIYPQFGEPLYDLKLEPARVWICAIPPLIMRYVLDEERRLVMVATLPLLMSDGDGEPAA